MQNLSISERFLDRSVELVPLAHALERCLECELLASRSFPRPVLDLGCGDGIFASVLFSEPVDVGLDPDPSELAAAEASGAYGQLVRRGGDEIPVGDGHFNTVFSNSVLEHIPDLDPVLREVHRVLAPGGRFYVTVPTDRIEHLNLGLVIVKWLHLKWLTGRWNGVFRKIWRFHNVLSTEGWKRRFAEAGFEVEDSITYQSLRMYRVREIVLPLSLFALATKKIANRWLLMPRWFRRTFVAPLARALRSYAGRSRSPDPGCLIFFSLKKSG